MNKNDLIETVNRAFDGAVFNRFGGVALNDSLSEDGNTLNIKVYDIGVEQLDGMNEQEQEKHLVVNESYDLSSVDFNDRYSVMDKTNRIVTHFEATVYHI